ncbi:hypothetical protein ES705_45130 [subsurface metagenome]
MKIMFDTNIWIYYYTETEKSLIIEKILIENFSDLLITSQILGEFYNVITRKIMKSKKDAQQIISEELTMFPVIKIGKNEVLRAIEVSIKYEFSYWDSLVIASALENGCEILYSEDMQHNQIIEDKLKIKNPYIE